MGVLRMGYVHAKVTDLAEAKQHYGSTLGLYETRSEPGSRTTSSNSSSA